MSRFGKSHDNPTAKNLFHTLNPKHIGRRICLERAEARDDVFDTIGLFYNPKRRHSHLARVLSKDCEDDYFQRMKIV